MEGGVRAASGTAAENEVRNQSREGVNRTAVTLYIDIILTAGMTHSSTSVMHYKPRRNAR